MALNQQNLIGLDIGTRFIKIVKANGRGKITRTVMVGMPDGVIRQGKVDVPGVLTEKLREAKRMLGINFNPNCALCITGPDVLIRQLTLPVLNRREEIYLNVVNEISGYLPVDPESFSIDFRVQEIVKDTDGSDVMRVMVVAIPKDILWTYIKCIQSVGWRVKYIDITENAREKLLNYLVQKGRLARQSFCVLDLGFTGTSVCVYRDGQIFFSKKINTGSNKMVESVAEGLKLDPLLAEKMLYERDCFYDESQTDLNRALAADIDYLVNDITRVFEYFSSRNSHNIKCVYVCGGGARIPGLVRYFEEAFRVPVRSLNELIKQFFISRYHTTESFNSRRPCEDVMDRVDFSNALGVTFREVEKA